MTAAARRHIRDELLAGYSDRQADREARRIESYRQRDREIGEPVEAQPGVPDLDETQRSAMKATKLKQEIYVVSRDEKENRWLEALEVIDNFEDGDVVGVYKLVGVRRKRVEHSLKP